MNLQNLMERLNGDDLSFYQNRLEFCTVFILLELSAMTVFHF